MSALALSPAAQAARPPVPSGSSPRRDAMTVEGTPSGEVGKIVIFSGIQAMAQARRYGTNAALWTSVRGIGCDDARRFLATGVDQCGRIHGQSTFPNPNPVICARGVRSRHGDSGGPVYTRPDPPPPPPGS